MIKMIEHEFFWNKIEDTLNAKSEPLIFHLIKIYAWGRTRSTSKEHWKEEVYSFVNSIQRIKGTKRFPPYHKIFNALWDSWGDRIEIAVNKLNSEKHYKEYERIEYSNNIDIFCKTYIKWLSDCLSKTGEVYAAEVDVVIEELLGKY